MEKVLKKTDKGATIKNLYTFYDVGSSIIHDILLWDSVTDHTEKCMEQNTSINIAGIQWKDQPDNFRSFIIGQEKARVTDLLHYAKQMESIVSKDLNDVNIVIWIN